MRLLRREFLHLAAGVAALPAVSRIAGAQTAYPTRPLRCIVGYAPGGGTDIFVRLLGQLLPARLGQPFVIENRPGASSNLATETVIRGPADGYTLLGVDAAAAINATLYDNLSFNFVRDIAVIGMGRSNSKSRNLGGFYSIFWVFSSSGGMVNVMRALRKTSQEGKIA
jgi:tripartite-type tricarboxylate transporter receptor subunit TctC